MTLFLTSSPCFGLGGQLNPANGLIEQLRTHLPEPLNCLLITSAPDDVGMTDRMAWDMREAFDRAGLPFDHYEVLDRRTQRQTVRMIANANLIILCGGHVPTQNKFFHEIRLRQRLQKFTGTILSISDGSMNCADRVYACPELDGETLDPHYKLFLTGLGLTFVNILPHYQYLQDAKVDGRPMIADIATLHSYGHPIILLNDGSYFIINGRRHELRGQAYLLHNGQLHTICREGEQKRMLPDGTLIEIALTSANSTF